MSDNLKYSLELLSDAIPASGNSTVKTIDSDVIADKYGLPYIPGKRIKGLLRESAIELLESFGYPKKLEQLFDKIFGEIGNSMNSGFKFSDVAMEGIKNVQEWLDWLKSEKNKEIKGYFTSENILDQFTLIRRSTAMENGLAKPHSLRTIRVLKKGLAFKGSIHSLNRQMTQDEKSFIGLVMKNMRYLGSSRNRGLGYVSMKSDETTDSRSFLSTMIEGDAQ